jgi:hypothetical protein
MMKLHQLLSDGVNLLHRDQIAVDSYLAKIGPEMGDCVAPVESGDRGNA